MKKVGVVIVAAGRGIRAGGGTPKQWRRLGEASVAEHAIRAFTKHPSIGTIILVVHPDDADSPLLPREKVDHVAVGGETRSASVIAGLQLLKGHADIALIHDAARPCVSGKVISDVIDALETARAAAPAIPVVDALWTGENGSVTGVADRTGLFRAQTPQGFYLADIIAAHLENPDGAMDDVEIARRYGIKVAITPGDDNNLKITTPEDFERAAAILRIQHGY